MRRTPGGERAAEHADQQARYSNPDHHVVVHAPVQGGRTRARPKEPCECLRCPRCQHEGHGSCDDGKHHALQHHLPHQLNAIRPERLPDRKLTPPGYKPHQRERRHVRAGQQQHHSSEGQQDGQRRRHESVGAEWRAPHGIQRDPVLAQMIVRKRRDNIVHHGVEILGRLATDHSGPQSSYYVQPDRTTTAMRDPPHIRPEGIQRHPQIVTQPGHCSHKPLRRHTDHGHGMPGDLDRFAHIYVSPSQEKSTEFLGAHRRARNWSDQDPPLRNRASRPMIPASSRTTHPFAV